ncbi:unnamed protein product [Notodromas monacha]|uniref:Aminotransferase class I/classII large domain-containing protein n=1 Tax=Notodromas monacha TaxID=399045 RepID=A0A7R9BX40_9CRUS|nr:unnamed protein product [Notodromas monacha]CAG0921823.1 unnamed protein product [Notodromas monacha]
MTQTTTTTELSWSETMELLSNKHPGLATLKHSSSMARHSKLQSKSNSGNNPTNNKTTKPGTEKLSSRRSYGFLIFDYIPVLLIIYAKVVFNVVYALSKLGVVSPKWVKLPEIDPKEKEGYAPIRDHHTRLFQFTLFNRISDLFARPINTLPADTFRVIHRPQNPFSDHVEKLPDGLSINMASYNYLGFSTNTGPIPDAVKDTIKRNGLTFGSNSRELGTWQLHRVLEKMVAKFVGKEDAILCPMGFATNSMHLPALADDRTLIISDEHNHSSLILGCKLSGATIKVFKHNEENSRHGSYIFASIPWVLIEQRTP